MLTNDTPIIDIQIADLSEQSDVRQLSMLELSLVGGGADPINTY